MARLLFLGWFVNYQRLCDEVNDGYCISLLSREGL